MSLTAEPFATVLPLAGLCASTVPGSSSTVSLSVTLPTRSPADSIALRAFSSVSPTTSGTSTCSGPLETRSVTVLPRSIRLPCGGEVSTTRPFLTSAEKTSSTFGSKPAARSWSSASARGSPCTSGTLASPGPVETVIVTVEPSGASVSGRGSCAATSSRSTSAFATRSMFTSKPRFWRICEAVASSRPITFGTTSCSGFSVR